MEGKEPVEVVSKLLRKLRETSRHSTEESHVLKILQRLSLVPMTLDILHVTHVGKEVNGFRKWEGPVGEKAKLLVKKWKQLLPESTKKLPEDSTSSFSQKEETTHNHRESSHSGSKAECYSQSHSGSESGHHSRDSSHAKDMSHSVSKSRHTPKHHHHRELSHSSSKSGHHSTFLQEDSHFSSKPGCHSTFLQEDSHFSSKSGRHSTFLQEESHSSSKSGRHSTFLQEESHSSSKSGCRSTFLQEHSHFSSKPGCRSTFLQEDSHSSSKLGRHSTFLQEESHSSSSPRHQSNFNSRHQLTVSRHKSRSKSPIPIPSNLESGQEMSLPVNDIHSLGQPHMPNGPSSLHSGMSSHTTPRKRKANVESSADVVALSKKSRTQVYSGKKTITGPQVVPSLFDMSMKILIDNIDAIDEVGGVPFLVLEPVLQKCTPTQLMRLEEYNPHFLEDSDVLWAKHCQREFKAASLSNGQSWRELYMDKLAQREEKLKSITASIRARKEAREEPMRQAKLATPTRQPSRRGLRNPPLPVGRPYFFAGGRTLDKDVSLLKKQTMKMVKERKQMMLSRPGKR